MLVLTLIMADMLNHRCLSSSFDTQCLLDSDRYLISLMDLLA